MTNRPLRSWFWKIFKLIAVLLLIGGLVDLLMVAGRRGADTFGSNKPAKEILNSPISTPSPLEHRMFISTNLGSYDFYDPLSTNPNAVHKPIRKVTLILNVTPERIFARYDVYLAKDHPLFEIVQTSNDALSEDSLVTNVLGRVNLGGSRLWFFRPETSVAANDPNAHFYLTSESIKPIFNYYTVSIESPPKVFDLRIEKSEVVIQTDKAQVWPPEKSTPYSKTSELTIFARPANPDSFQFFIHFPEGTITPEPIPAAPPPLEASEPTPLPTLGALLSKSYDPPGIGWILYGSLASLPFLLFLYWTKKYDIEAEQPGVPLKVEAIQIYLALHFAPYFVLALDGFIREWGNPAIKGLRVFQEHTITVFNLAREHEMLLPLTVMFVYVWPAMVVRWEQRGYISTGERWRGRAGQILLIPTLIALAWWAGSWVYELTNSGFDGLTVRGFYSSFISVLLLALVGASAWLAFEIFDRRRAGAALLIALLFVVLLAAEAFSRLATVSYGESRVGTANKIIGYAVFIVTVFMLVSSVARLTYRVIRGDSVSRVWKIWSYRRRGLVVLAILLISLSTKFWTPDSWRLMSLAFELGDLFLLALVWILVDFLKYKSSEADWLQLPQSTRQAGILLALVTFYSSMTRWNYIPVAFLVGFILLDKWLLPTKRYDQSLFSEIKGQLPRIIKKIIDFNDAEKTLGLLKKELLSQVAKGNLTHEQYLQKLEAQNQTVDDLQKDITIQGQFAKQVVLAFGPTDSAWENGKKAALYSLSFCVPWTILFMRSTVRGQAYSGSYLILDLLSSIIFFLLHWVGYGFIFGYFYPYIKGNNGIQKGLSLFLTIVFPSLVWTGLALPLDRENWFSFGLWVLQVFVHTMLLGLVAGDYETLRRAGFRWKHLLEIHRVGALSAWASSVLIAIGAAVSALIGGYASQLITLVVGGSLPPATGK